MSLRKSCDVGLRCEKSACFLRSSDANCQRFGLSLRFGLRCECPRCQIASDAGRAMRTTKSLTQGKTKGQPKSFQNFSHLFTLFTLFTLFQNLSPRTFPFKTRGCSSMRTKEKKKQEKERDKSMLHVCPPPINSPAPISTLDWGKSVLKNPPPPTHFSTFHSRVMRPLSLLGEN